MTVSPPRLVTHRGWKIETPLGYGVWWFACDQPERPADLFTLWPAGCDGCTIALVAAVRAGYCADAQYADEGTYASLRTMDLAGCLEHARAWRAEQGLRVL